MRIRPSRRRAVDLGHRQERLAGQGVGRRHPALGAAAQHEPAGAAPGLGDPVGVGDRQQCPGLAVGSSSSASAAARCPGRCRPGGRCRGHARGPGAGRGRRPQGGGGRGAPAAPPARRPRRAGRRAGPAARRGPPAGRPAGRPATPTRPRAAGQHHAGQPRVQRQATISARRRCRCHAAPPVGRPRRRRAAPEVGEQAAGLVEGAGGRRVEERQRRRVGAPGGQLQGQARQVGLADLGLGVRPPGGVVDLRPQADGCARPEAAGAARPLLGRRPGDGHGLQPGQPRAGVEHRPPGQPGVDDHPHALDGEAGLGDVGGQHDLAPAGQARGQGRVLLAGGQRPVEPVDVDRAGARPSSSRSASATRSISPAPGRNTSTSPPSSARRADRTAATTAGSSRSRGPPGRPPQLDGMGRLSLVTTGAGPASEPSPSRAATAVAVERGRHHEDAEVGPQVRPGVEGQRQAQVGLEAALVELVEDHQPHAVEAGVALQPPGEDALGHHLDPGVAADGPVVAGAVADRAADLLAEQRRHPPGRGPGGQPAGFEHDDAPVAEPLGAEQGEGDRGGLAGAGGGLEHGQARAGERGLELGQGGDDRQGRGGGRQGRGHGPPGWRIARPPVESRAWRTPGRSAGRRVRAGAAGRGGRRCRGGDEVVAGPGHAASGSSPPGTRTPPRPRRSSAPSAG